ncbi:hypothetical protein CPC08DRAFT_18268 [Agrocybe pediades]|nr:hypothetical protein CPC08DRAFT_18268 [Agrocybe pediades]
MSLAFFISLVSLYLYQEYLLCHFYSLLTMEPKKRERSMSYRKPVPVYIPSPLPSPTLPFPREIEDDTPIDNIVGETMPPLPDNWREILESKTSEIERALADVPPSAKALPLSILDKGRETVDSLSLSKKLPELPTEVSNKEETVVNPTPIQTLHPQNHRSRGLPTVCLDFCMCSIVTCLMSPWIELSTTNATHTKSYQEKIPTL